MVSVTTACITVSVLTILIIIGCCNAKLVHVTMIYRHGHRSPITIFPYDNNTVATTWKDGLGQLTNLGKSQHYELGQFLRARYKTYLSSRYNLSEFYIRSTDFDRTLMSAMANLAGLYPPEATQIWNPSLMWQPIPVHTVPRVEDAMLLEVTCPRHDIIKNEVNHSSAYKQFYSQYAPFLDNMSKNAGAAITPNNVFELLDGIWITKVAKLYTPAWITDSVYKVLQKLGNFDWKVMFWNEELIKINGGVLLDDILTRFSSIQKGIVPESGAKMHVYSDHDTGVAALLAVFNIFDYIWPNFASCLLLELHSPDSKPPQADYLVRIFYRNDTSRAPYQLTVPGCAADCPLSQLIKLIGSRRLTLSQFNALCTSNFTQPLSCVDSRAQVDNASSLVVSYTLAGVAGVFIAVMLLGIGIFFWRKQRYDRLANYQSVGTTEH